jgi:predicted nucleotidyltransferase
MPLTTLTSRETNRCLRPNIGNYADEQAALDAVVARLVAELDPQAIWLFGSRARGDHRPDSDFDLLAVAKPGQAWGEDYVAALRPTHETWVGCDVVPCRKEDFDEALTLDTSFVSAVVEHGRLLYEAAP